MYVGMYIVDIVQLHIHTYIGYAIYRFKFKESVFSVCHSCVHIFIHTYVCTYIIGHYNPLVRITT